MSATGDQELVFQSGGASLRIPRDRMYSRNHCWVQEGPGGFRVGVTEVFLQSHSEIYFLEWHVESPLSVKQGQVLATVEDAGGEFPLTSPSEGVILDLNTCLLDDPHPIETDCYEVGWLFHLETDARFLSPEEYLSFLQANAKG